MDANEQNHGTTESVFQSDRDRLHAHYCHGGELAMSPLFAVMYALRCGEPLTLRAVCGNLSGYAGLDGEAKEIARRRITTHLARAARLGLVVKAFEESGRMATSEITNKGASFLRAGIDARIAMMASCPSMSISQICARITVSGGGLDATQRRRLTDCDFNAVDIMRAAEEGDVLESEDASAGETAGEVPLQIRSIAGTGRERRFLERVCSKQPDLVKAWGRAVSVSAAQLGG